MSDLMIPDIILDVMLILLFNWVLLYRFRSVLYLQMSAKIRRINEEVSTGE